MVPLPLLWLLWISVALWKSSMNSPRLPSIYAFALVLGILLVIPMIVPFHMHYFIQHYYFSCPCMCKQLLPRHPPSSLNDRSRRMKNCCISNNPSIQPLQPPPFPLLFSKSRIGLLKINFV